MRFFSPATLIGTLGSLVQQIAGGVNALVVSVISSFADAITDGNGAFSGFGSSAAVAANYSHLQLLNPAASGKIISVDAIYIQNPTGLPMQYIIAFYDPALTTLLGQMASRLALGVNGVGILRAQALAAQTYTVLLAQIVMVSNDSKRLDFNPPLRLGAGRGVVVIGMNLNTFVGATYLTRET